MSFKGPSQLLFYSCLRPFGEEVLYISQEHGEKRVSGIFFQSYTLVKESGFDSEVSSSQPVFELQEADLGFKPKVQDQIKRGKVGYKLINIEPNYQGQIRLILKRIEQKVERKSEKKIEKNVEKKIEIKSEHGGER